MASFGSCPGDINSPQAGEGLNAARRITDSSLIVARGNARCEAFRDLAGGAIFAPPHTHTHRRPPAHFAESQPTRRVLQQRQYILGACKSTAEACQASGATPSWVGIDVMAPTVRPKRTRDFPDRFGRFILRDIWELPPSPDWESVDIESGRLPNAAPSPHQPSPLLYSVRSVRRLPRLH